MKLQGRYNVAEIFTDNIDEMCISQIYNLLNNPGMVDGNIAIMPDVHVGKGSVVGFTMTFKKMLIPAVISVDIGCGIIAYNIGQVDVDCADFDRFINEAIPSGRNIRSTGGKKEPADLSELIPLINKICPAKHHAVIGSIGTLGGGNHFIELDKDPAGNVWVVVHSGSRGLGLDVCHYHQNRAREYVKKEFKGAGAYHGMEFMPLQDGGEEYLHDMQITQKYAELNRSTMCRDIVENYFGKRLSKCDTISSIHNYFNFGDGIIRKGAISAHEGERVIIPLNMRDGCIIANGKGNERWNFSAPHGAGRLFSRGEAKELFAVEEYAKEMSGIFSTCIGSATLDESPMAYKPAQEIIEAVAETVDIDYIMKPLYNFKAGG